MAAQRGCPIPWCGWWVRVHPVLSHMPRPGMGFIQGKGESSPVFPPAHAPFSSGKWELFWWHRTGISIPGLAGSQVIRFCISNSHFTISPRLRVNACIMSSGRSLIFWMFDGANSVCFIRRYKKWVLDRVIEEACAIGPHPPSLLRQLTPIRSRHSWFGVHPFTSRHPSRGQSLRTERGGQPHSQMITIQCSGVFRRNSDYRWNGGGRQEGRFH